MVSGSAVINRATELCATAQNMIQLRFFPMFRVPSAQEPGYQVMERDPISKMLCLNETKMMSSFQNSIHVSGWVARFLTI